MSTNGQLVFTDVDKITFKGVGNTSNAVVDTVTGKIGVGIDSPDANLHVLGNSYVSTNLELGGTLIMGTVNVSAHHSLEAVTAEGNTTPLTIEFSNATTGVVTTGNVEVGKELTVTGNATVSSNLTVSGNVEVGTANLFVDTVNSRVGIETDAPDATLHVTGNAYISSNLIVNSEVRGRYDTDTTSYFGRAAVGYCGHIDAMSISHIDSNDTGGYALLQEANGGTILNSASGQPVRLRQGNVDKMTIDSDGNVGIGASSPIAALDIDGGPEDDTVPALSIRGGQYSESDLYVLNSYNNSTAGGVGYAAKVFGVNIKNKLETDNKIQIRSNTGGLTCGSAMYLGSDDNISGVFGVFTGDGAVGTTLTEKLTVRANGNIGIGDSNPATSLHISKDYTASGGNTTHFTPQIYISGEGHTSMSQVSAIGFNGNAAASTHKRMVGGGIYYKGGGGAYGLDGYLGLAVANLSSGGADPYGITEGELESQTRLAIDNDGRVGIGTTGASYPLDVQYTGDSGIRSKNIGTSHASVYIDSASGYSYLRFESSGAAKFWIQSTPTSDLAFRPSGGGHAMDIKSDGKVGVGRSSPDYPLDVFGRIGFCNTVSGKTHQHWHLSGGTDSNTGNFYTVYKQSGYNATWRTRIQGSTGNQATLNFTGQHKTYIKDISSERAEELEGLIVSANTNKYMKMSEGVEVGQNAITINESLPIVNISNVSQDKTCFGVISASEDPENVRGETIGCFTAFIHKEDGDTRVHINSVGEGALWVVNTNGPIESGDYITSSNIAGYGMKQESECLMNYTVAKSTMDCDFNPLTQKKRRIVKEERDIVVWVLRKYEEVSEEEYNNTPEDKRKIEDDTFKIERESVSRHDPDNEDYIKETRTFEFSVLDENKQLVWEDTDETELEYKIRYLDANGNITTEENAIHKAAFIGCTYHCG